MTAPSTAQPFFVSDALILPHTCYQLTGKPLSRILSSGTQATAGPFP